MSRRARQVVDAAVSAGAGPEGADPDLGTTRRQAGDPEVVLVEERLGQGPFEGGPRCREVAEQRPAGPPGLEPRHR